MFGIFKKKATPSDPKTHAGPAIGAQLESSSNPPANLVEATWHQCPRIYAEGRPPAGRLVPEAIEGRTSSGFRLPAGPGRPATAAINIDADDFVFEAWSLEGDRAVARQSVTLEAAAHPRAGVRVMDAACMPGGTAWLAIKFPGQGLHSTLYRYEVAAGAWVAMARIEPDVAEINRYFDASPIGPDSIVVRIQSDTQRLAAEQYVNRLSRFFLFDPRHPDGIEVLSVAPDVGIVRRWGVVGRVLWIGTSPPERAGALSFRSLDLSRVASP